MSSYFMNSLMQRYYNQATPMYAAAAAAAAGRAVVDGSSSWSAAVTVDDVDAAAVFSPYSSYTFSRRHQQLETANHRGSRLPPRPASQSTCLFSSTAAENMSACRHSTPLNAVFDDAVVQSTFSMSTKLSPLVPYEAKSARHPLSDTASTVYHQQLHDDCSLVAALNGHCGTYKVECPSPPTTLKTEPQQEDVTETWHSNACYINSDGELDMGTLPTQEGNDKVQTPEKEDDDDLAALDDQQTTVSDDGSDDMVTGSTSTMTSTTMTTASEHHQQQQQTSDSSCDVKQTRSDVVYPIYPWMTRVHSTHGKSRISCTNVQK